MRPIESPIFNIYTTSPQRHSAFEDLAEMNSIASSVARITPQFDEPMLQREVDLSNPSEVVWHMSQGKARNHHAAESRQNGGVHRTTPKRAEIGVFADTVQTYEDNGSLYTLEKPKTSIAMWTRTGEAFRQSDKAVQAVTGLTFSVLEDGALNLATRIVRLKAHMKPYTLDDIRWLLPSVGLTRGVDSVLNVAGGITIINKKVRERFYRTDIPLEVTTQESPDHPEVLLQTVEDWEEKDESVMRRFVYGAFTRVTGGLKRELDIKRGLGAP